MTIKREKLKDHPQHLSWFFYGPSKSGKTTFSSKFPKPLFLVTEPGPFGGLESIRDLNPEFIKISSWSDAVQVLKMFKKKDPDVETIVCSSLTYLSKICMEDILSTVGRERPLIQDWGTNADRVRGWVIKMCELPYTIIFEANDRVLTIEQEDGTSFNYIDPDLPGRMSRDMPAIIDEVFYFYRERYRNKEAKRFEQRAVILTCPDKQKGVNIAGDRTGRLDPLEIADYNMVMKKIRGRE